MFIKYLALALAGMACLTAANPTADQAVDLYPYAHISYGDVVQYWRGQGALPDKTVGEGDDQVHYWSFNQTRMDAAARHLESTGQVKAPAPVTPMPRDLFMARNDPWYYKAVCDQTGTKWGNLIVGALGLGNFCSYAVNFVTHLFVVNVIEKRTTWTDENHRFRSAFVKIGWVWEKGAGVSAASVCSGALGYLVTNYCNNYHSGNVQAVGNDGKEIGRGNVEITPG